MSLVRDDTGEFSNPPLLDQQQGTAGTRAHRRAAVTTAPRVTKVVKIVLFVWAPHTNCDFCHTKF
jgi:hypothetical protein